MKKTKKKSIVPDTRGGVAWCGCRYIGRRLVKRCGKSGCQSVRR